MHKWFALTVTLSLRLKLKCGWWDSNPQSLARDGGFKDRCVYRFTTPAQTYNVRGPDRIRTGGRTVQGSCLNQLGYRATRIEESRTDQ